MMIPGNNWGLLFIQLVVFGAWLILTIRVLLQLRQRELPETARAIWAAMILIIPIGGAITFWIVQPDRQFPGR